MVGFKLDVNNVLDVAFQTAVGVAVPGFNKGGTDLNNAIATALCWGEISTLITCADVVATNTVAQKPTKATIIANELRRIQDRKDSLRKYGGCAVY